MCYSTFMDMNEKNPTFHYDPTKATPTTEPGSATDTLLPPHMDTLKLLVEFFGLLCLHKKHRLKGNAIQAKSIPHSDGGFHQVVLKGDCSACHSELHFMFAPRTPNQPPIAHDIRDCAVQIWVPGDPAPEIPKA